MAPADMGIPEQITRRREGLTEEDGGDIDGGPARCTEVIQR
jgi:hypothetical protein